MGKALLGKDARLYRNTGTYGSPTWTLVANVRDLSLSIEKNEADASSRASDGWEEVIGALKKAPIEFAMVNKAGDADVIAIRTAFFADADLEFLVLDGPVATVGKQGLRATMTLLKFGRSESLQSAQEYAVAMKPTPSDNPPSWFVVPVPDP